MELEEGNWRKGTGNWRNGTVGRELEEGNWRKGTVRREVEDGKKGTALENNVGKFYAMLGVFSIFLQHISNIWKLRLHLFCLLSLHIFELT